MHGRYETIDSQPSRDELDQWLYAAGHDLAEPARTVRSFLDLLERRYGDSLDADARDYVGFAVDAAKRLEAMLAALLEFARIGAEPCPENDVVDLNSVVEAIVAGLLPRLEAFGGRVEIGDLPVVPGDRKLWRRLFAILIENALVYRSPAPPLIRIDASAGRITIADNGIGIDPRFVARIFEPFQRLHTRDAIPGCGMGLTIAKRIAEHHGTTLDVEPGESGGSVFVLTLPSAQPPP